MFDEVYELLKDDRYEEARVLIRRELKQLKRNDWMRHWWLTKLSSVYYEERRYRKALSLAEQAFQIAPRCPLVLWDYAGALEMVGREEEALSIWSELCQKSIKTLAHGKCGEGTRWAKALRNDCRFRIADVYRHQDNLQKARLYFLLYIRKRREGVGSIYTQRDAKKKLDDIQKKLSANAGEEV